MIWFKYDPIGFCKNISRQLYFWFLNSCPVWCDHNLITHFFENSWYLSLRPTKVILTAECFGIFERYCFLSIFRKCVRTVMHDRVWIVSLIIWNLKFQFCELWKFRIFDIFPVNINKVISISTLMFMKESKRMHKFVEWSSATMTSITKTFNDWNSVFMK